MPGRCLLRLLTAALLLLAVSGCDSVSLWLSGVDRESYVWEPQLGNTHPTPLTKSLDACVDSGDAAAGPAAFSIVRSEDSPAVTACMVGQGYRKAYQSRVSLF